MTRHERLEALRTEASAEHAYLTRLARRAGTIDQGLNAAIAATALAIAATSAMELRTVSLSLAMALIALLGLNLLQTNREREKELCALTAAWRHHRIDTARLIQRNATCTTDDDTGAAGIDKEIAQLEHRIENTRIDATLYEPTRRREPGTSGPNAPERATTSGS